MTGAALAARLFLALSGPFVGDYVATLAAAWPRAPSPILGRSRCARCGAPITPLSAIPLVSWALRGGRRGCCSGRIPIVYPLGEGAGLVVGLAAAILAPGLAAAAWAYAVGMTLAYVALVDLRRYRIPTAGLIVLALEAGILLVAQPQSEQRLARLATGAVLALVFEVLRRLVRRDGRAGLGEGDVMLAGILGVLVNWRLAAPMVFVAAAAPLAIQFARRKFGPAPLGLWLCISCGFCVLVTAADASLQ
jgi:prepilin signal peptidase PulO-like enzyme (type II secretory pathway)